MNRLFKNKKLIELISTNPKLVELSRSVNYGFYATDNHNILSYINEKSLNILDYKINDLIGKDASIFSCSHCSNSCGFHNKYCNTEKTQKYCTLKKRNGETITILKSYNNLIDDNGAKLGKYVFFEKTEDNFISLETVINKKEKHSAKELILLNLFF